MRLAFLSSLHELKTDFQLSPGYKREMYELSPELGNEKYSNWVRG